MDHPLQPGPSAGGDHTATAPGPVDHLIQDPALRTLRSTTRGFAFPVTVGFLLWYLLYVLLSSYAHGFMAETLFGSVNVALLMGLLQFVSTFAIAAWYARFAHRRMDPIAEELRLRHAASAAAEQVARSATPQEAGE
ncbi:DUF485 domain-containing protein [Kitasatospora sp. RB6PN24]|uniref:DUF485 domain-containing protein n=1 Tax=Kitasatospora humi TaxID=2893891 RepID=UPI001E57FB6E|nr:DUF485 domain-containing protein [Kitasatospora humi]MCC9308243.1 DUF485 domain-containing protein [Kitasatospora humi]